MLRTEAVTSTGENPQKLLNIGLCHGFFDLTTEADTNKWDNVKLKKKKKFCKAKKVELKVKVTQLCPTLCDPLEYIQSGQFSRTE